MKGFKQSIQRLVKKGPEEESNELQNLGNLLKENENHLENIFRNGLKSIRSARLAAEDNHGFGDCLGSFADAVFVDDDHQTGQALRLLSDFLHTSEHRRNDYLRGSHFFCSFFFCFSSLLILLLPSSFLHLSKNTNQVLAN